MRTPSSLGTLASTCLVTTAGKHRPLFIPGMSSPAQSIPPLTHAIGGSLGSSLALLLFYPLERARIEMQSAAAREPQVRAIPPPVDRIVVSHDQEQVLEQSDEGEGRAANTSTAASTSPRPSASTDAFTALQGANRAPLMECFKRLWERNELYRGVKPVISTLAASNFIFFYLNALMRSFIVKSSKASRSYQLLVASCLAGVANVLLTNPLWVVNTRIVAGDASDMSFLQEMRHIIRTEGIRHLWSGTITSLLLVSNPVIQFFAYEELKGMLLLRKSGDALALRGLEAFVLGAMSKAVATVLTYPLQLAQVVLRLQHHEKGVPRDDSCPAPYRGTLDCLVRLYRRDGLEGLFTGMRAKLLQTVMTAAFTFLTYEQILHALHATHTAFLLQRRSSPVFATAAKLE
jgi:solute carrier family 25 (peroxisomal adenine nucleotide transporter), member 17